MFHLIEKVIAYTIFFFLTSVASANPDCEKLAEDLNVKFLATASALQQGKCRAAEVLASAVSTASKSFHQSCPGSSSAIRESASKLNNTIQGGNRCSRRTTEAKSGAAAT